MRLSLEPNDLCVAAGGEEAWGATRAAWEEDGACSDAEVLGSNDRRTAEEILTFGLDGELYESERTAQQPWGAQQPRVQRNDDVMEPGFGTRKEAEMEDLLLEHELRSLRLSLSPLAASSAAVRLQPNDETQRCRCALRSANTTAPYAPCHQAKLRPLHRCGCLLYSAEFVNVAVHV
eukprot:595472-Pleurochrysis_carterae.AAC.1